MINGEDELPATPVAPAGVKAPDARTAGDGSEWRWAGGVRSDSPSGKKASKPHKPLLTPSEKKRLHAAKLQEKRVARAAKAATKGEGGFDLKALYMDMLRSATAESDDETSIAGLHDILMTQPLSRYSRKVVSRLGRLLRYSSTEKGSGEKRSILLTAERDRAGRRWRPDDQQLASAADVVQTWLSDLVAERSATILATAGIRDAEAMAERKARRKARREEDLLEGLSLRTPPRPTPPTRPKRSLLQKPVMFVTPEAVRTGGVSADTSLVKEGDAAPAPATAAPTTTTEDRDESTSNTTTSETEDESDSDSSTAEDEEDVFIHHGVGFHEEGASTEGPPSADTLLPLAPSATPPELPPSEVAECTDDGADLSATAGIPDGTSPATRSVKSLYIQAELRGAWESHTTGIGSKLLAKMGYTGGVLGKRCESGSPPCKTDEHKDSSKKAPFVRFSSAEKAARRAVVHGETHTPDGRMIVRATAEMPAPLEAMKRPNKVGLGAEGLR